ncbi:CWC16 protein [Cryptosporidium felis]|nr:CWC16 protein [Cryptosporidium felis]
MSERKVINRYFPPDFDPKKLEENKKLFKKIKPRKNCGIRKKKFLNIRMLYPFTVKCDGCNLYHYVGTKFNSKVEKIQNESYLGIPIWRFYGRCTQCGNTIVFKTDPKSGNYVLESGAKHNFIVSEKNLSRSDENDIEKKIISSALESRTMDELEVIKTLNKRLMNREVTELDALKCLLDDEINQISVTIQNSLENQVLDVGDNYENLIFEKEQILIAENIRKCYDSDMGPDNKNDSGLLIGTCNKMRADTELGSAQSKAYNDFFGHYETDEDE